MENAAEALRLAAWVLIFIMALSISMNAFAQARQSIDQIIINSDREYITTYIPESNNTQRIVGAESIVPTIYRAYKENFKIRFVFLENDGKPLYYRLKYNTSTGRLDNEPVYEIDLVKENLGGEKEKAYLLKRILFGSKNASSETFEEKNIRSRISTQINFDSSNNALIANEGLYDVIKQNRNGYIEKLGIYLQGEENGTNTDSLSNKTEKRVVTYEKAT